MNDHPELRKHFGLDDNLETVRRLIEQAIRASDPSAPAVELSKGLVAFKQQTAELAALTADLCANLIPMDVIALERVSLTLAEKMPQLAGKLGFTMEVLVAARKIREAVVELAIGTEDEANHAADRKEAEDLVAAHRRH
jgi:hypothetical protein